jgi:hypothetical protein
LIDTGVGKPLDHEVVDELFQPVVVVHQFVDHVVVVFTHCPLAQGALHKGDDIPPFEPLHNHV